MSVVKRTPIKAKQQENNDTAPAVEPNFLAEKIESIVEKAIKPGASDDVRFNLTLSNLDNRRLEYLRRRAKMTKQEFVTEILLAAMSDIEIRMGLTAPQMASEYREILTSKRPISILIKDSDD